MPMEQVINDELTLTACGDRVGKEMAAELLESAYHRNVQ